MTFFFVVLKIVFCVLSNEIKLMKKEIMEKKRNINAKHIAKQSKLHEKKTD